MFLSCLKPVDHFPLPSGYSLELHHQTCRSANTTHCGTPPCLCRYECLFWNTLLHQKEKTKKLLTLSRFKDHSSMKLFLIPTTCPTPVSETWHSLLCVFTAPCLYGDDWNIYTLIHVYCPHQTVSCLAHIPCLEFFILFPWHLAYNF